jgi:hypothetical protein
MQDRTKFLICVNRRQLYLDPCPLDPGASGSLENQKRSHGRQDHSSDPLRQAISNCARDQTQRDYGITILFHDSLPSCSWPTPLSPCRAALLLLYDPFASVVGFKDEGAASLTHRRTCSALLKITPAASNAAIADACCQRSAGGATAVCTAHVAAVNSRSVTMTCSGR